MALQIYASADSASGFSVDGNFSNPVVHSFNGVTGGTLIKKYYLRNDNDSYYYNNVQIYAYVESGQDITDGTSGFGWKLREGSNEPLEQEWTLISNSNTIAMDDIGSFGNGDNVTYYPFWLRVTVPENLSAQSFDNVKLRISYTENIA